MVKSDKVPFTFTDTKLFEKLADQLLAYLNPADTQKVLGELRNELVVNIRTKTLPELHSVTLNCVRCADVVHDPVIPKWNLVDPDIVIIIDAPPLCGENATILVDALKEAKFSSTRTALTFVNRCPKKNDKHTKEEIDNCTKYLFPELQLLKPKLIIPLGSTPTTTLLGVDTKITDVRGKVCWLGPWAIMPTYSPSHVLRGAEHLRDNFEADIKTAYNFCYGEI